MLERLQSFFQTLTQGGERKAFAPDDPRIAVAALCFQVMEADGLVHKAERDKLRQLLREQYGLEGGQLEELLDAGQKAESEAVDYYRFTSDLKRHLNEAERQQLVGILWDIVYADGDRSEMEDHVIWRIADLLGVSGRDRVNERRDAVTRAGLETDSDA
ncbi:TerB family tellurite resistance protein [Rhizobium sp. S95]|uniref:TerB family tellurite resistance protein n=1 Tax=Ciceribacter sichuanensis TaxID=2949647 RepID=A0AAJ1BWH1_9HYPH|nr:MULTISPECIES: TerB family tellurite resistance protein [unclassified Ciceribacter]MCM2396340.1 TerB family tellurite resistance protein [Ciceribacter sp. S95]MCM2402348.1 TerB family tellurite resistance protein [Ciceribacter sp. S153]MCO5957509.1 TerB family tellurite resistance protein [Ciceribacter sp. S101]